MNGRGQCSVSICNSQKKNSYLVIVIVCDTCSSSHGHWLIYALHLRDASATTKTWSVCPGLQWTFVPNLKRFSTRCSSQELDGWREVLWPSKWTNGCYSQSIFWYICRKPLNILGPRDSIQVFPKFFNTSHRDSPDVYRKFSGFKLSSQALISLIFLYTTAYYLHVKTTP